MRITVNGREADVPDGATVLSLLADSGLEPSSVVVELCGDIVPGERFAETRLRQGDVVEILRFVGGG